MTNKPPKPRRRWFQFSLRTLLIAVTLVAGSLVAWRVYVEPYRRQRETMALIKELGGSYKTERAENWLRWLYGDDFQNLVLVDVADCDEPEKYIEQVASLPKLETLVVGGRSFTDELLSRLERLATLNRLVLDSTDVSDDGIGAMKQALPALAIHKSQRRSIEIVRLFERYTDNHAVTDTRLYELARMALATKKGRTAGMSAIISSLSHDDPRIKRSALESLVNQRDTPIGALEPLTERLADSDGSIRWKARKAICSLGPRARSALPNLKKLLSTSEEREFINILVTMCAIAPKDMLVVSSLLEVASNKDQPFPNRQIAVILLGGVGRSKKKAIQTLLDLHPEPNLRFWVTKSLFRLAPENKDVTTILLDEIRRADDLDLTLLTRDLPSGQDFERAVYLKYLSEFQRIMVEDEGISGIRAAAAVLRIDRKNQRARQKLEDALLNGDADRQNSAAHVTTELQIRLVKPQIVAKLIKKIEAKEPGSSYSVFIEVLGLTRTSDGSALRTLQSYLTDESPFARQTAALALVRVDQKRHARPAIVKYLRQTSNHYYFATVQKLSLIAKAYRATDVYVEALVAMLDSPLHRIHALRSLSKIGPDAKGAYSRLIRFLDDPSAEVRQRSIEILGRFGNGARKAIPRLRELQRDKDMFVRWQAEDAILKISAESNDD